MRKGLGSGLLGVLVLVLAGCGGGGANFQFAPPPTGSFSNASFSGFYAFSLAGTNTSGFFSTAGVLQADGSGHITWGTQDINSATNIYIDTAVTGTYSVGADGRGTALLNSNVTTMTMSFVLISPQHGLISRFDSFATASGTIDRQEFATFSQSALQGNFAFSATGVNGSSVVFQAAGALSLDSTGSITAGVQDENDGGGLHTELGLTGSVVVNNDGIGTAQLTTARGTLNFTAFVVDADHVKLLGTDTDPALGGDLYRRQGSLSNASFSGAYAFTLGGASGNGPFAAGGVLTSDGNGRIVSGTEDINDGGNVTTNLSLTGTYALAANGRGTMTLNSSGGASHFAIYPWTGGVQLIQIDAVPVSGGTVFPQSGAMSNSAFQGKYGFNLSGAVDLGPADWIAQLTANGSGGTTGAIDSNLQGSIIQGLALAGNYSLGANGRGTWSLLSSQGRQNLMLYAVSNSRVLVFSADSNTVAVGVLEQQ